MPAIILMTTTQIKSSFPSDAFKRSVNPNIPFPAKKHPTMHAVANDTIVFLVVNASITASATGTIDIHPIVSNKALPSLFWKNQHFSPMCI